MRGGECEALVAIDAGSPAAAGSLARALEPDNRQAPSHVRVSCAPLADTVVCEVHVKGCGDPKRILTLRNTVDDLVQAARAALEALEAAGE